MKVRGSGCGGGSARAAHIVCLLVLFLMAPIHFIGLFPHFSTEILGDVMDAAEYPWNEYWTAHALLDLRTSPFWTDYMFYPLGFRLTLHTYTFLDGLLYTLVRPVVPLLVFHNALTWLSVFLNGAAAYALVFSLTDLPGLALVGGMAFAHSPVLTSYYGPQTLIEPYLFVFFVLAAVRALDSRRDTSAIGAGVLLGLSIFTYPYYFVAGALWLAILTVHRVVGEWKQRRWPDEPAPPVVGRFRAVALTCGLTLGVVLMPRSWWQNLGVPRYLRTTHVLGMVLLGYLLTRTVGCVRARWSTRGEDRLLPSVAGTAGCRASERGTTSPTDRREAATSVLFSPRWRRVVLAGLLVAVTAALVALPYPLAYLGDPSTRIALAGPSSELLTYSVDVASIVAPFHPWLSPLSQRIASDWKRNGPIVATPAFLGWSWVALVALGVVLWPRRPDIRVWLTAWTVFLFMCLGPYLKIHGIVLGSFVLPAYVLSNLPILHSARTLSRFLVPLVLFTIVVGCLVLGGWLARMDPTRRGVCYVLMLLVLAFEYALLPYPYQAPRASYEIPAVYRAVAEDAGGTVGVLLDLPLFTHSGRRSEGHGETRSHFFQTAHGQKLVGGVSSILGAEVFAHFRALPGIRAFWSASAIGPDELAAALETLGVNRIVFNKQRYRPEVRDAYLTAFRQTPYLTVFFEDATYVALWVDRDAPTFRTAAAAWKSPEAAASHGAPSGRGQTPWPRSGS